MDYRVIKENDVFYLSDYQGMALGRHGLFSRDTRFLSRMQWSCEPDVLVLLESEAVSAFDSVYRYTNEPPSEKSSIARESLLITRHQWIGEGSFHEGLTIENFAMDPVCLRVSYLVDSDFADMFELRGFDSHRLNRNIAVEHSKTACTYRYVAQDGRINETRAEVGVSCTFAQLDDLAGWSGTKEDATQRRWQGRMRLEPRGQIEVSFSVFINPVDCQCGEDTGPTKGFERIAASHEQWLSKMPKVSGCLRYAAWYNQGLRDVRMLQSNLGYGNMIVAGVPWYAVPFGRDSLIAARQLLLAAPEVARGTLWTMAQFQGQEDQPDRDEQPGKVVHEVRDGELSRIGLLPFAPYYGSVDATPLFLMLLADYYRWTGDEVFLRSLLPNVERAFRWMQEYGDRDGDGFLEYWQEAREGIANQGWKDSGDSIMYADGRLVEGPVALCEVQAYAHRAYADWAEIYSALGMTGHAQRMRMQAIRLQDGFNQQFVQADKRIALALDGHKQPCLVTSSNMGQVLVSDLIGKEIADVVAQLMVSPHMLTGFGIRTLSSAEVRYNPLSYHNGSVWPHDTSLIVYGLRRYGYLSEAIAVIDSLLRAQDEFDQHRLPELFAGFSREESLRPVPYPVSCSPQAWAAAIPVFILEQLIGLRPDALRQSIGIDPVLPPSMTQLEITGIRLGVGILSLRMWRSASAVDIDIIENSTGWVVCRSPYVKGGVPR
ncbi:glycogen debranching N-terminal domain-containing protein [Sulfobacillus sp. hq2]|uniref:amylo-alpha-1,6-glucosidase n=1 Tax=Sulfobacillus sp. hq2 TaxID=2039167 RepID=UPI000CD0E8D2|nr:glycogen debranching N-terminal domain-containing protein [Sulfobacillus sp. hq2]POB09604.1 amylo-alpha-1,6-glucosidase [Sulfobacillus sp. hq2]